MHNPSTGACIVNFCFDMTKIREIISVVESGVPVRQQEDWDNSGWQVAGCDPDDDCRGVLTCVDVTPAVVAEASEKGCNLILSHHPLIFKGLKRLTGATEVEKSVMAAMRGGIAVYASHTALDVAPVIGLSHEMGHRLGLTDTKVLAPRENGLLKLVTFVPHDYADTVAEAVYAAGAGCIGDYDRCSYRVAGTGTFRALDGTNPFVGERGCDHAEPETRIEIILPAHRRNAVEAAIRSSHPYEEPAFDFYRLENENPSLGLGVIGTLPEPMEVPEFVELVKNAYNSPAVRCSGWEGTVKKVALCTGSGGEFITLARSRGADAYITSDVRYHDFVDHGQSLLIVDTGHFESEACCKDVFSRIISEKFPNFAVYSSRVEKNPVTYM